jgi:dTMP kinase
LFITFEGPDGSGKTTQIQLLYQYLREQGYPAYLTREPGGTSIGDQIRAVLHDVRNTEMRPEAEILLYSASRAQLVGQVIRPRLAAGEIVLCDRYAESTLAYQGYGRQLDLPTLRDITAFATGGLRPDLVIYLDLPVEEGLRRRLTAHQVNGAEWNRLDQEETAFHLRVRAGYLQMAAAEPDRWLILDAARPVDVIQQHLREAVIARLASPGEAARDHDLSLAPDGGVKEEGGDAK